MSTKSQGILDAIEQGGKEIISTGKVNVKKGEAALKEFLAEIAPDVEVLTARLIAGDSAARDAMNLSLDSFGLIIARVGEGALAEVKVEIAAVSHVALSAVVSFASA